MNTFFRLLIVSIVIFFNVYQSVKADTLIQAGDQYIGNGSQACIDAGGSLYCNTNNSNREE